MRRSSEMACSTVTSFCRAVTWVVMIPPAVSGGYCSSLARLIRLGRDKAAHHRIVNAPIQIAEQIDAIVRRHGGQDSGCGLRGHGGNQLGGPRRLHPAEDFAGGVGGDVLCGTRGNIDGQQFQRHRAFFRAEPLQSIRDFARIVGFSLNFPEPFVAHGGLQFSAR